MPHVLRRHLPGHYAATVAYMGWLGKKNGELLALMAADGFDVLLTVDQGLRHQQNLTAAGVAVILLIGATDRPRDLIPLMPAACAALTTIRPGNVVEISNLPP